MLESDSIVVTVKYKQPIRWPPFVHHCKSAFLYRGEGCVRHPCNVMQDLDDTILASALEEREGVFDVIVSIHGSYPRKAYQISRGCA